MSAYRQKLSLIVPFFNEEKILTTYIVLRSFLSSRFSNYELIFVSDGSTDKSVSALRRAIKKDRNTWVFSYKKNRGRGYAVKTGFKKATGELIGYIDADLEIDPKYITQCVKKIERFEGVVVSKYLKKSTVDTTPARLITSKIFNFWVRLILNSKVADHQTGLKIFKRKDLLSVLNKVKEAGWLFDVELLYYLQRDGKRIGEIPINIRYGYGKIRLSFLVDFLKSFYYVLRIRAAEK